MDYKQIKLLLEKFYDGKTSVEEELVIQEYFKKGDIPGELYAEKELFESFQKIDDDNEPAELKSELTELIEERWAESTRNRFKALAKWSIGVAASISIGFMIFFNSTEENTSMPDTYVNEQEAYNATKNALLLVSEKMEMASNKLSSLQQINSKLQIVNSLDKIDDMIDKYNTQKK